jgi:HPt (histidine-containing phosphotransfer) domain-containing protein
MFQVIEDGPGVNAETVENPITASTPAENILDKQSILALFEGDTELIREVAGLFLEDCPRQMSAIRGAVENSDAAALNRAAHSLKGSVSNFAAPGAFLAAQRLENMGRENDLRKAREAFRCLEEQVSLLRSAITGLEKEWVT